MPEQDFREIARTKFGYERLRLGQEMALRAILAGQDTLAVMPTGSGKSAIYQIAAVMIPGATVVVSPLLALQQDQIETIAGQDHPAEAGAVSSAVTVGDRQEALDGLESGHLEFLFLAPEQFNRPETLERLQAAQVSLFVVDEAHCISEWGHDFRPDYLRLGTIIEALGHPRVLALTATAAPPVREEIVARLGMRRPQVIVRGFDRPNLWLSVDRFEAEVEKQEALLKCIAAAEKPGLVYAATKKKVEEIAALLVERGIRAEFYHAGRTASDRKAIQTAFMQDEWEVLVATTAFGMGVDKPNIRFVFHADIPESIDSYYQEIGRGGRDGNPASALLFYQTQDLGIRKFFAGRGKVEADQVQTVLQTLIQQKEPVAARTLQEQTQLSRSKLQTVVHHLVDLDVLATTPTGEVIPGPQIVQAERAIDQVLHLQERQQQLERSRLEMMRGYAESRGCRRQYLLGYFGEMLETPCGFCDNCKAGLVVEEAPGLRPYPVGSRVIHKQWDGGMVMRYEGNKIVILFDQVGYKTLDTQMALLRGLLKRTGNE
ncbi:MAG: ATP-dependent DNA helicase RecQ [Leptolyngbyaceae cyanobacterium bins.59]|nr:ATP-dependent DNA helicase RecQ [Leptolyngbyaceae cyanobacterium bins.59]